MSLTILTVSVLVVILVVEVLAVEVEIVVVVGVHFLYISLQFYTKIRFRLVIPTRIYPKIC